MGPSSRRASPSTSTPSSSSRPSAGPSASTATRQSKLINYFARAPSASPQPQLQHQHRKQPHPLPRRSPSPPVATTSAKASADPSQSVHLAALGRGFASTQTPTTSLFKWAPDQAQPAASESGAGTTHGPRVSIDDDEEERRWLERAQRLSTKSKGSDDSTSPADPVISPRRERARSLSSDSILASPRTAKRLCVDQGDSSPIDFSRDSPEAAPSRTPDSARPISTGTAASSPTSPVQETPYMHESLGEYSLMAWEEEARRKAPQYRISAGLQPTANDIAASRQVDRDAADKARREAIARSIGAPVPAAQHPIRGDREPERTHAWPPPRPSVTKAPPNRPASPRVIGAATNEQRAPLSPRREPNAASGSNPSGSKPAKPAVAKRVVIEEEEQEEDSGDESPLRAGPSPPRPTRFSSSQNQPAARRPFTPAAPLAAIRSPRTNRRVYALETQDGNPLPSPFVACRLFGPHANRPRPPASRPRPPPPASTSAKAKASEESSSLSSPPSPARSQQRERSPLRDIDSPSPTSSPPTPHHRGGYVPDETYREPDPPSDIPETPARSQPPRTAKSTAKGETATAKRGPLGQALGARLDSARAAAQRPVVARRTTPESGGNSSSSLSSPPSQETQPLDGPYDDEDDETILETKAGKVQRSEAGGAAHGGDDREATQPLAFAGEDEESSEEEMLGRRPPPRRKSQRSPRRAAAAVPPALTRWATVNDAWAGLRQNERSHASATPTTRQQTLGRFGFDESTRLPSTQRGEGSSHDESASGARRPLSAAERAVFEEHPLPRDQTDELSDGEDADGEDEGEEQLHHRDYRRKPSDIAVGKGRDAADDSGFVDAANSPLQPARRPQQQQKRPLPSPTRNWTATDAAADDDSDGETQPLAWDHSSSQSSHTEDESPTAVAAVLAARAAQQSPKKKLRLAGTQIRRATGCFGAGDIGNGINGGGGGGSGSSGGRVGGDQEKTPSSSQTSASSSASWLPKLDEGAPHGFESFLGGL